MPSRRISASIKAAPMCGAPTSRTRAALYTVLAIAFALSAFTAVYLLTRGWTSPVERFAAADAADAVPIKARLVYLKLKGCGWCERFQPTWDAMVKDDATALRAQGVVLESYEASDPGAAPYVPHARGYPTVLLARTDTGDVTRFEGERERKDLLAFVEETMAEGSVPATDGPVPSTTTTERFGEVRRVSSGADQLMADAQRTVRRSQVPAHVQASMATNAGAKLPNPYA